MSTDILNCNLFLVILYVKGSQYVFFNEKLPIEFPLFDTFFPAGNMGQKLLFLPSEIAPVLLVEGSVLNRLKDMVCTDNLA